MVNSAVAEQRMPYIRNRPVSSKYLTIFVDHSSAFQSSLVQKEKQEPFIMYISLQSVLTEKKLPVVLTYIHSSHV